MKNKNVFLYIPKINSQRQREIPAWSNTKLLQLYDEKGQLSDFLAIAG